MYKFNKSYVIIPILYFVTIFIVWHSAGMTEKEISQISGCFRWKNDKIIIDKNYISIFSQRKKYIFKIDEFEYNKGISIKTTASINYNAVQDNVIVKQEERSEYKFLLKKLDSIKINILDLKSGKSVTFIKNLC
jgi:hypothetical protein